MPGIIGTDSTPTSSNQRNSWKTFVPFTAPTPLTERKKLLLCVHGNQDHLDIYVTWKLDQWEVFQIHQILHWVDRVQNLSATSQILQCRDPTRLWNKVLKTKYIDIYRFYFNIQPPIFSADCFISQCNFLILLTLINIFLIKNSCVNNWFMNIQLHFLGPRHSKWWPPNSDQSDCPCITNCVREVTVLSYKVGFWYLPFK